MLRIIHPIAIVALSLACLGQVVAHAQSSEGDLPLYKRHQWMTASGSVGYGWYDGYTARGEFANVFAEVRLSLVSLPRGADDPYIFEMVLKNNGAARYFYNPWFRMDSFLPGNLVVFRPEGSNVTERPRPRLAPEYNGPKPSDWVLLNRGEGVVSTMSLGPIRLTPGTYYVQLVVWHRLVMPRPGTDDPALAADEYFWHSSEYFRSNRVKIVISDGAPTTQPAAPTQ